MQNVIGKLIVVGILLSLTGCLLDGSGSESGTTVVASPGQPFFDPKQTICDPFKTNSPQARDRGLIGNLVYLTNDQPRYGNIADFMTNAVVADATVFLDRLFVPTRPFDRGFYLQSGELVKSINGDTLYEYFGLRMKGQVQLATDEIPGQYQFAVLADDGALLKIPDGLGREVTLVNNDGTHPTKLMCATDPVTMTAGSKLPITLEYYQGPRFHIAMVVMWRPWPDGVTNAVTDPLCGQQGNSLYFDSTKNPVEPKLAYYELLDRGWKVLQNENYSFPEQADNPCAPTEPALMINSADVRVTAVTSTVITVEWTTNIPATSQLQIKNTSNMVVTLSPVDPTLVQNHSVTFTGLTPATLYAFKVLSTSTSGQIAESDERTQRTGR